MNIEQRITAFSRLGDYILRNPIALQEVTHQSYRHHSWFTPESIAQSLKNIAAEFLSKEKLENWLVNYTIKQNNAPKTIAIVAAGNIPMVAFHDILCVLISGNKLQLKLSDKDKFLLPFLLERLIELESSFKTHISIQNRLENFDAIIATGSNSSAQHFEFYFGKYKNIIRRNRNSVAILNGTETAEELQQLGHDIFDYFGLGCRNVSKILIPNDFDLLKLKASDIPNLRRRLGIVFQDFQLLTDRSIEKNLQFVLEATGWRDKTLMSDRIDEVLSSVGMQTKKHKMPHELSGGEQQRIAIARALLNHPELILADEPTGNLDPETSNDIMTLLKSISTERQCAVLMATHDYHMIQNFPGEAIKCEDGGVTMMSTAELFE